MVSAALNNTLRTTFLNTESNGQRIKIVQRLNRDEFRIDDPQTERIRELIRAACETTREFFAETLAKGKSLKKDDVRRGSTQRELLHAFFLNREGSL